jgi:hypothetical protein
MLKIELLLSYDYSLFLSVSFLCQCNELFDTDAECGKQLFGRVQQTSFFDRAVRKKKERKGDEWH